MDPNELDELDGLVSVGDRSTGERRGLRVAYAADTHLHADFLSGAVQLATEGGT